MIKRTLFFGSPAYLSTKNEQLLVQYPQEVGKLPKTVPIEDVGVVMLEDPQITITNKLLEKLVQNNVAVIHCDSRHMPIGLIMPLVGHSEQQKRFQFQLNASLPLQKNLWQQTVQQKIANQGRLMEQMGLSAEKMFYWSRNVKSGDGGNHEARAAAYYWERVLPDPEFTRDRGGKPPNNLLNYGYAILRAITARALVASGLLPVMGIHHHNKYNPFCLADDIMEPYRPFVDALVFEMMDSAANIGELTTPIKVQLLQIPILDVTIDEKQSPLMVAMSRTTNSLVTCFEGATRKLLYPQYGKH